MKKILIVEGNLREENDSFSKVGIQTHTQSLKDSLAYFTNDLTFDVVNPSSDKNIEPIVQKLSTYDGLIWGGSSLNIYNDTPEIRRQIEFMRECQKNVKKILAICWGMQVAVTAAGGEVKKADNSNIGIANDVKINEKGSIHPLYKDKDKIFMKGSRISEDQKAGVGNQTIIDGTGKWKKLIGASCVFGIKYVEEVLFSSQNCKFPGE